MPALESSFTAATALSALLTAECLLFAATNVGVALSGSALGQRRLVPASLLAAASTALLFGALTAWWEIYLDNWQGQFARAARAISIFVGITAQPMFSLAVALNVRR